MRSARPTTGPGLGGAYPDWMHDFTLALVRESHGNYMRWMHVSPQRADVSACDRLGIVEICPAGDKERMVTGRQWDQRVEVMRDSMIFYRNNPSIFFWEAGNTIVSPEQMVQMVDLAQAMGPSWRPRHGHAGQRSGGRQQGADPDVRVLRRHDRPGAADRQDRRRRHLPRLQHRAPRQGAAHRDGGLPRRSRAQCLGRLSRRRILGSNPRAGSIGGRPVDTWHWNSETFCLAAATRYASYVLNRIDNPDPAHSKWSAYCSIYFTDSDADGRQQGSYVLRVSGKVDGVRLPKEIFYVSRVMQNEQPDLHIIGHWNYPAGTNKTVYVAASHCDQVELFLNGKSLGVTTKPFKFVDTYGGRAMAPRRCPRALIPATSTPSPMSRLPPARSKPSPPRAGRSSPSRKSRPRASRQPSNSPSIRGRKGLQADGSDVALVDFEVVDAQGRRCPTDEARVDFDITGPAIWRGGFNAAKLNTTNNRYLDTECGINRVAIRSTSTPGAITLTAKRDGLKPATLEIKSTPVEITAGLSTEMPQQLPSPK